MVALAEDTKYFTLEAPCEVVFFFIDLLCFKIFILSKLPYKLNIGYSTKDYFFYVDY